MRSRVMCLDASVCVYIYIYVCVCVCVWAKDGLFGVLQLENLPLV